MAKRAVRRAAQPATISLVGVSTSADAAVGSPAFDFRMAVFPLM
jgi:hypothetical protein